MFRLFFKYLTKTATFKNESRANKRSSCRRKEQRIK